MRRKDGVKFCLSLMKIVSLLLSLRSAIKRTFIEESRSSHIMVVECFATATATAHAAAAYSSLVTLFHCPSIIPSKPSRCTRELTSYLMPLPWQVDFILLFSSVILVAQYQEVC